MKVPKKGQENEPGAGARTVPSCPLQSRRVGQQEPPPVPFPSRAAELGVAAQQERGLRSPPTIPAGARLHRAAQAAARPPRGLRVRARHLRPPPSVPRGARPGGSSPLPRPCPQSSVGTEIPAGSAAAPPRGGRGPSGGSREPIPEPRAGSPLCPRSPRLGTEPLPSPAAGGGGSPRGSGAGDGAGGTRSAPAGRDPPAEGDISPWPKTPSTNTAET